MILKNYDERKYKIVNVRVGSKRETSSLTRNEGTKGGDAMLVNDEKGLWIIKKIREVKKKKKKRSLGIKKILGNVERNELLYKKCSRLGVKESD